MIRLLVVAFAIFTAFPVLAERRVALVMAADAYRTVRPLNNAVNDGRAIAAALRALHFEVITETDRDLRRMRRALEDFREDARGADVAVVYFAGHGVEIGGENRLLPVDANAASLAALENSSLPLEEVRAAVFAVGRVGLILLDACRNDPFGAIASEGRGAAALTPEIARKVTPGLGRVGLAENMLFAFAAAPGQTASDGDGGNSPFSAALARYLATDGLEIRSVLTLVQQEVYDRSAGRQLPYVESGLPQLFFASTVREKLPERERLLLAMADVTPELRAEVEQVATDAEMPLAPLYGALIASNAVELDPSARAAKLQEAAEAYVKVREDLKTLGAADPKVALLRGEAEQQLAEGAFDAAREKLAQAADIDSRSRQALEGNISQRTLSEAATRYISAGAAKAELRYRLAIDDFEKALALFNRVDNAALNEEQADRRLTLLEQLGTLYTSVGDIGSAARVFRQLVDRAGQVAESYPDDLNNRRDLAISHQRLGDAQITGGNLSAAYENYDQGRTIMEQVTTSSSRADWLQDLAMLRDSMSWVLVSAGNLGAAYESSAAALEIKLRLAARRPADNRLKRDLTVTYDALGDIARAAGELPTAREAYAASLALREEISATEGDDAQAQRDLSISHDKIGDALSDAGSRQEALVSYRAGLRIIETLAARDPNETNYRRDMAVSHSKIGNVERDMGDLKAALPSYRKAFEIDEQLAAEDPNNLVWQRGLSISLEKIADIQRRQGNLDAALFGYERGLEISRRLADADPSNAEWQRDLSISLAEIADLKLRQRDYQGAGQAFSDSLDIRIKLAGSDPGNMVWQRDLMLAYVDFSRVAVDRKGAIRSALAIADALDKAGRLSARDRKNMEQLRLKLRKLK